MHSKVKIVLGRCFEDPLSWWYKILFYNAQILFPVISSWFCPLEDFFFSPLPSLDKAEEDIGDYVILSFEYLFQLAFFP